MAIHEKQPKPRIHDKEIVEVFSLEERHKDEEAWVRMDALLFRYIFCHKERLKKWLDQGRSED